MRLEPTDNPYADGVAAGWLNGRYEGFKTTPECPWPEGTPEHEDWYRGFGDGTEDFIAWQRSD
jgi:hypothetical protein